MGPSKKRSTPQPHKKFPPSQKGGDGDCLKNVKFILDAWRVGGGIVNFLCGRYGSFLEQPSCNLRTVHPWCT